MTMIKHPPPEQTDEEAEALEMSGFCPICGADANIHEPDCIEVCPHDHVLKDDDGRDYWFYVCDDCDQAVYLTEPDEDGHSYWEAIE